MNARQTPGSRKGSVFRRRPRHPSSTAPAVLGSTVMALSWPRHTQGMLLGRGPAKYCARNFHRGHIANCDGLQPVTFVRRNQVLEGLASVANGRGDDLIAFADIDSRIVLACPTSSGSRADLAGSTGESERAIALPAGVEGSPWGIHLLRTASQYGESRRASDQIRRRDDGDRLRYTVGDVKRDAGERAR